MSKEASRLDTLTALVADVRAAAASATPGPWGADVLGSEGYEVRTADNVQPVGRGRLKRRLRIARCGYEEWETDKSNAAHIAANDPAATLRRCELDEEILHMARTTQLPGLQIRLIKILENAHGIEPS